MDVASLEVIPLIAGSNLVGTASRRQLEDHPRCCFGFFGPREIRIPNENDSIDYR